MSTSLTRGFGGPLRYIQGPGELNKIQEYTEKYGDACIVIDGFLYESICEKLTKIFAGKETNFTAICFNGECCREEISRIQEKALDANAGVFVGIGGGKTLDTTKLCADEKGLPVIVVPTAASTDAPVSEIAVLYTKDGEYIGSKKLSRNSDLVLVDTEIILTAPKRLFAAGIGDALATYFEALACSNSDSPH
ncbi:MAG: iron-containing alcohol dehydrogenase, partial [Lachnospiraceae bacterium]|nr:iron-containing alcohol dehydrogenase [Lachnospiraceae bacterium]